MKRMNVIRILFSIVSAIVLYISVLENWSKINRENLCPLSLSLCPIYLELQALCIAYLSPRTKEISKSRVGQNRNETITFHVRDVLTRSNFRPKSVNVFMVRVPLESPVCLADAASLVLFERDPITSYKLYLPRVTQILILWRGTVIPIRLLVWTISRFVSPISFLLLCVSSKSTALREKNKSCWNYHFEIFISKRLLCA